MATKNSGFAESVESI